MKKTTLTKKLLKFILPLLILPTFLLSFFYYQYLTQILTTEIIELSKSTLNKSDEYLKTHTIDTLLPITIIDKDLNIILASKEKDDDPYIKHNKFLNEHIQEVLNLKDIGLTHFKNKYLMVKPLLNTEGKIIAFSIYDYESLLSKKLAVVDQTFLYILFIIIFIIFISIVLTIVFSCSITHPIKLLIEGTRRIIKGDLSYKIEVSSNDEVGELVQTFNSMTEKRKDVENSLKKQNEMLNKSQKTAKLGSWKWDMITNEVIWTDEVFRIFGEDVQSFVPTYEKFLSYFEEKDIVSLKQAISFAIESHKPYNFEHKIKYPDKSICYLHESGTAYYNHNGDAISMIGTILDVTEQKKIELELIEKKEELREQKNILDHQAHHDSLTGLPNRALFNDRLTQSIKKAKRSKTNIALFFIDLDYFKEINDSLGHAVGDEILKDVAKRLKETIRAGDTLSRLGGDEFTVILENLAQEQDALLLAQKILKVLSDPFSIDNHELQISSSIGISLFPKDATASANLLKNADSAMYKAKDNGRNNFQFYDADLIGKVTVVNSQ